jgi:hypothetical protein
LTDEEARELPVQLTVEALEQMGNTNWMTDAGPFDILADLKDTSGSSVPYEVLVTRSSVVDGWGHHVQVAALTDVIAAKTFANRAKDREALPELIAIERGEQPGQEPGFALADMQSVEPPQGPEL